MPQCPHCDKEVAWDASFCPNCGKRKPAESSHSGGGPDFGLYDVILFGFFGGVLGFIVAFCIGAVAVNPLPSGLGNQFSIPGMVIGSAAGAGFVIYEIFQSAEGKKRLFKQILWTFIVIVALILFTIVKHATR